MTPAIPRVIHRIWIGGTEPEWIAELRRSWDRPGWQICDWNDRTVPGLYPLRNQEIYDDAPEICPDHAGQLRADILRYEILQRYGGVYVDADLECLKPIDELVEPLLCFAAYEDARYLNNAFMGAIPRHRVMTALVAGLRARIPHERPAERRPNRLTGPHYLTAIHGRYRPHMTALDRELVYPYAWNELERAGEDFPRAFAVHHWANQRRLHAAPRP